MESEIERGEGVVTSESGRPPVRVLIVAPSLDILGGQAVQAARLLERFRTESSIEVSFLPINPRLPGAIHYLQRIKYLRTIVTSMLYIGTLLVRVPAFDILHVFSASYFSFILAPTPAILVGRLYGKKVLLNYRSGEAEDHLQNWPGTTRPILRLVDAIAVPSGYLVDVFAQFGLTAKSIFNFVDTDRFRFRERRPLRPIFLSNRNLVPLYNVGCVLRAFAMIQEKYPDSRLLVAGDGSERDELEQLTLDLNLRNVDFLGRVDHEQMADLYASADIYLNSPNIDNMPGSIIEAYASGLPIVTTNAGGIPYIVSNRVTGILVPKGAHAEMAAGALCLLADDEFAAKLAEGAHNECRKYTWTAVRPQWLKLYSDLIKMPAQAHERTDDEATRGNEKLVDG